MHTALEINFTTVNGIIRRIIPSFQAKIDFQICLDGKRKSIILETICVIETPIHDRIQVLITNAMGEFLSQKIDLNEYIFTGFWQEDNFYCILAQDIPH